MPFEPGLRRAWALALVTTDREDFQDWKFQEVIQGSGIVTPQEEPPEADKFLQGYILRRERELSKGKKRQKTAFCYWCGWGWTKRRKVYAGGRSYPAECPYCHRRNWNRPKGGGVRMEI